MESPSIKIVQCEELIHIPPWLARCPYCGGLLVAQPESWIESSKPGLWVAEFANTQCTTEPTIDEIEGDYDDWIEWINQHTVMPYVYWLPVDQRITKWLAHHYRFKESKP